jgi:hypothetical protein
LLIPYRYFTAHIRFESWIRISYKWKALEQQQEIREEDKSENAGITSYSLISKNVQAVDNQALNFLVYLQNTSELRPHLQDQMHCQALDLSLPQ